MNADQVRALVSACYPRAMASPVALAFAGLAAADEAARVCNAATWELDDTAAMLSEARDYVEKHEGSPRADLREYLDCWIESNWPDASEELREQVVARAFRSPGA